MLGWERHTVILGFKVEGNEAWWTAFPWESTAIYAAR